MPTVELTEADSGRSIEARTGDEIVVRLPENATTGYRWQIDSVSQEIEPLGNSYELDSAPGRQPKFGGGGIRQFRFRAKAPAAARIELKRLRPWEGAKSVDGQFDLDVAIQDS